MQASSKVFRWQLCSSFSRRGETTVAAQADVATSWTKPLESMPGPRVLPGVGTTWIYFPWVGFCRFERNAECQRQKYQRYGPIVKEVLPGGVMQVNLYNLNDVIRLPEEEGQYPNRGRFNTWVRYKELHRQWYKGDGLIAGQNEDWQHYRKISQPFLLKRKVAEAHFLPMADEITSDFVQQIGFRSASNGKVGNFLEELHLMVAEIITRTLLGISAGALRPGMEPSDDAKELAESIVNAFDSCVQMELSPIQWWKWLSTPQWKRLTRSNDYITSFTEKYLGTAVEKVRAAQAQGQDVSCLLHYLMEQGQLEKRELFSLCYDLFCAAVETTANALSFILYDLAKHQRVQDKVAQEVQEVLPPDGVPITVEHVDQLRFVKAAIKETLRLVPINTFIARILDHDTVFSGYRIPKGVVMISHPAAVCMQEDLFPSPLEYRPERWMEALPDKRINRLMKLTTFGFGLRSCIGQRLAQYELWLTTAKIVRKYRVEWEHPQELGCLNKLTNSPDMPVEFKFVPRN